MKRLRRPVAGFLVIAAFASPVFARFGSPPDWVLRLAAQPTPDNIGSAPAVALLREHSCEVDANGNAVTIERTAIRVLRSEGAKYAYAVAYYDSKTQKVETATAWLIREGKEVEFADRGSWTDGSSDTFGSLYTDLRWKSESLSAVHGDVFVAETRVSGPLLCADDSYEWGSDGLPVVRESYRLRVPPKFVVAATVRGSPAPTATASADNLETVWSLGNEPYVPPEDYAPEHDPKAPTLLVRFRPPGSGKFNPLVLNEWRDLGVWLHELNCNQRDSSPELIETVNRLTVGCTTPLAKIRALGGYVQHLRYATILQGHARGYGFQPHKASQVLHQGYGDCKDKANLLCALLSQVGIEAYSAAARVGDDVNVCPDFPSAMQFNHAICAIRVDDSVKLPAVVSVQGSGNFLFFDPTSEHTAVGDLPWYEQGTFVYLQDPASGNVVQLPEIKPAEGHKAERRVTLRLGATGSYTGHVTISGHGQFGAALRQEWFNTNNPEEVKSATNELLGPAIRGAHLEHIVKSDDLEHDLTTVEFDIAGTNYLQFFPNALAAAKTEVLTRRNLPGLAAPDRKQPVKIAALALVDLIELQLPEGMRAEELPASATFTSPHGHYSREFKVDGQSVKLERRLELNHEIVPASDYAPLKKFLLDIAKADRASVLLRTGA